MLVRSFTINAIQVTTQRHQPVLQQMLYQRERHVLLAMLQQEQVQEEEQGQTRGKVRGTPLCRCSRLCSRSSSSSRSSSRTSALQEDERSWYGLELFWRLVQDESGCTPQVRCSARQSITSSS